MFPYQRQGRALSLAAGLSVLAGGAAAQSVPVKVLSKPDAQFQESFDQIIALSEVSPGRVMVTDVAAKSVLLADIGTGSQSTVGRNGQGPGEYQFPGGIFLHKDTVFVVDRVSRRFLLASTDGKMMGKTIGFPDGLRGIPEPRGMDGQGRVYFQGSPFGGPGDDDGPTAKLPDSTAILRWDRATNRIDTVAMVKIPSTKRDVTTAGNARMVLMRPQPYSAEDDWSVGTDGRVAVARSGNYHVEWFGNATTVTGKPVAVESRKVTDLDKRRFMDAMRSNRNRIMIVNGPGGSRDIRPPEPGADEFSWPENMPVFRSRGTYVTPEGQAWVSRQPAGRDTIPTYDVFDGSGTLVSRVQLPVGRRMIGVGEGVLYALYTDSDGLQWLERFKR